MASGLEKWLSGRASLASTKNLLGEVVEPTLTRRGPLPELKKTELSMVSSVKAFLNRDSHTADSQRELFGMLGRLNRDRSLVLAKWRTQQLEQLAKSAPKGQAAWIDWERQWLPIWEEEAELTYQLQLKLLKPKESTSEQNTALLRKVLALQLRGQGVLAKGDMEKVQGLSQKRITVIARAAEQLVRLERSGSRGAVRQVRKLSKKLDALTSEFREARLARMRSL